MPKPLITKANSFPSLCSLLEMGVLRADFTAASSVIFEASATALKYQDALPLYRQSQIFTRHGAHLPRNTLARWMVQTGERLLPLIETLRKQLLNAPLIHMDETTLQVNQEEGRKASANSYMWVQRGGPPGQQVVLFDDDPSRAGRVPLRLLGDYSGCLVTDGYESLGHMEKLQRLSSSPWVADISSYGISNTVTVA